MTVCINFDNSYARLPPRMFARLDPTSGDRAPARAREHQLGRTARHRSRRAFEPGRRGGARGKPGARRRGADRARLCRPSVRPLSCRSSATGARSCSGRSSAATARAATSSSRAPARRRSRAAATAARRWARCCASIIVSEAMAALGMPTTRALAAVDDRREGAARDAAARRRPDPRRRRATSASARSSISPPRAIPRRCGAARRSRDRPPLSGGWPAPQPLPRVARRRRRAAGGSRRASGCWSASSTAS